MFAYSNNGSSMRSVEPSWTPMDGEIFFDHRLTEDELLAAFPGRSDALAAEALDRTQKTLTDAMQSYLDHTAQERGYDGILSMCSYATSTNPRFGPEGQAGVSLRDAVWAYGYQIIAEVQAGTRPVPTAEELVAALPSIVWPS